MSTPYSVFTPETAAGLSDIDLQNFVSVGVEEMVARNLPLPERLGELGVRAAVPRFDAAIATPNYIPSTALADGRLIVMHADRYLIQDGQERHLAPQLFSTLSLLAKHADQIVDADTLVHTLWRPKAGGVIGPRSQGRHGRIYQVVNRLRIALGQEDLGDTKWGVIQSHYDKGWEALTSLGRQ